MPWAVRCKPGSHGHQLPTEPRTCPMGPIFMMLANCSYMMLRQGDTHGMASVRQA